MLNEEWPERGSVISLLIPHSAFRVPHSSFRIPHSSFSPSLPPMLLFPPTEFRKRRGRRRRDVQSASPPVALTLIAAEYFPGMAVTLTFDQPIDIDAIVPSAIVVQDGEFTQTRYVGNGADLTGPTSVEISLVNTTEESPVPDVRLTAAANVGIIATDGPIPGGAWTGITNLVLPFP